MNIVCPDGEALPNGIVSASVVDRECALADAFATALMVRGKGFLDELSNMGLPAMCIYLENGHSRQFANNLWRKKQI